MMKNIIISLIAFIIVIATTTAMGQGTGIRVGDPCPDVTLSQIVNFKTDHAKISDFKGKLLILDFWATWCAPCVSMISISDSLQKVFDGKIQILSVTDQDAATVTAFLNKMKVYKSILMPSVTGDTKLRQLFPHVEIPHYVWINADSKVVAITGAEQMTSEVIKKVLSEKEISLPVKVDNDKTIDEQAPMFKTGVELVTGKNKLFEQINNGDVLQQWIITKYLAGFGCEQHADSTRITCKNSPIGELYRMAAGRFKLVNLGFNSTLWETNNPDVRKMTDSAVLTHDKTRAEIDEWMRYNTFCYEITFPPYLKDKKYDLMLENLNSFFGMKYNITGGMERRKVKCLVLVKISKNIASIIPAGQIQYSFDQYHLQLKNASITRLLNMLSINLDRQPPLVDSTNDNSTQDFVLNCNMADVSSVNTALAAYGLQLVERVIEREMIVIKDKPVIK